MTKNSLIVLGLVMVIGIAAALFMVVSHHQAITANQTASSTPNLTGKAIFTDGEHGFTITYPETYRTDYTFTSFYHLPANWRENALPEGTGTPIISIIGERAQSDHSYPRYFDAEIRIGASNDPKELARCETAATAQAEVALPDAVFGGATWKVFSFQDAAMMQYVQGVSYRTLRNGTCIALEQIKTGSSYRDDPVSKADIPQAKLDASYTALEATLKSFTFVR